MLKQTIQKVFNGLGYEVRRSDTDDKENPSYVLHSYLKADGSFDYDNYRQIQIAGNKRKINTIWVLESSIEFLSEYIKENVPACRFGICHGTRRGKEQEWFRKYLDCEVIGTEISDTANEFPHTIQWDFHEVKPEWINSVDFIYSNSFDHSYDPQKCLNSWMRCLNKGGVCILEHSSLHEPKGANELDPFGADLVQMPYLISKWGDGRYGVRNILPAPVKKDNVDHLQFIVIQNF
jgi:hypothetical protein